MKENKLIAEFMGVVFHDDENQYYSSDGMYIDDTLKYHTSWNWLMPVIEKIGIDYFHTLSSTIEMLAEYYYKDAGDNQDGLEGIEEFHKAVVFWIENNNNN
jgi:hypothetical protein